MTAIHHPLTGYPALSPDEMQRRAEAYLALMRTRRTVRHYSDRPVPRALIETCLLAAGTAPSGANHQPWHFAAISNPDIKRRIRLAAEEEERAFYAGKAGEEWLDALSPIGTDAQKPFLETAPWLIACFGARKSPGPDGRMRKNYYVPESVNIAIGMLITALHSAGLATLTHTPNPMGFLNEICQRPETEKPYVLLVTGYPAADATVPDHALRKKALAEFTTFL
jgi:iodotyrosine deiodinase